MKAMNEIYSFKDHKLAQDVEHMIVQMWDKVLVGPGGLFECEN